MLILSCKHKISKSRFMRIKKKLMVGTYLRLDIVLGRCRSANRIRYQRLRVSWLRQGRRARPRYNRWYLNWSHGDGSYGHGCAGRSHRRQADWDCGHGAYSAHHLLGAAQGRLFIYAQLCVLLQQEFISRLQFLIALFQLSHTLAQHFHLILQQPIWLLMHRPRWRGKVHVAIGEWAP